MLHCVYGIFPETRITGQLGHFYFFITNVSIFYLGMVNLGK